MPSSFISCTTPSPSSHEAAYQQIPHHVALTVSAHCNAVECRCIRWWSRPQGREGQEWCDVRVNAVVVHQLDLPLPIISRGGIPTNTTPRRTYQIQWQCCPLPLHSLVETTAGKERTRVVRRESQCRRRSSAGPPPSPSSHEATYQQIPHHVALTARAHCNAAYCRGFRWWR